MAQEETYRALEPVWQKLVVQICCKRLGAHLALCLLEDYAKFVAHQPTAFSAWLSTIQDGGLIDCWAASEDFPARFFKTYPVAWQTCEEVAVDAVVFAVCVRQSMQRNHATIVATLGDEFDSDHIVEADPTLGDFHEGRSTIQLRFANGHAAYWKPRPAFPESAFYALWDKLQSHLGWQPEIVPKIAHLGDTHLVSHIARQACADRVHYWQKSGALLALTTLLGVRDLHYENVIAACSCPIPVDLEVILTGFSETEGKAPFELFDVYRTGLLPCQNDEPEYPEISGFFSSAPLSRTRWLDASGQGGRVGADFVLEPRNPTECNLPIGAEGTCDAEDLEHLKHGYATAILTLKRDFEAIFTSDVTSTLEEVRPRKIVIGTQGYYRILRTSSQPQLMKNESARNAFIDVALDEELQRRGRRLSTTAREATVAALRSWNIPLHRDQSFAGGVGCGQLAHVLNRRLGGLQRSLAAQEHLITTCGFARMRGLNRDPIAPSYVSIEDAIDGVYASLQGLIFHQADGHGPIVVGLREKASINADPCILVEELSPGYYSGRSGVAIALAAYGRVRGNPAAQARALSLLNACTSDYLNLPPNDFTVPALYGIDEGIAGLVYALSITKRLLPHHEHDIRGLFDNLWPRIELLTLRERPAAKDVLTGVSGMILALLAAGRAFENGPVMPIRRLAKRLLDQAQPVIGSGLLHGGSGVALTLLRVFEATGEEQFLRAVPEFLLLDDRAVHRAENGHLDITWCHGILGSLIAKAHYTRITFDRAYSRFAADTLAEMHNQLPIFNNAAVCCGRFGLALFEQALGNDLDAFDPLAGNIECFAPKTTMPALRADWKATGGNVPLNYSAGLFTGMSGVLYCLLRSVDGELPNFAVFD